MKLTLSDLKSALGACGQIASNTKESGKWILLQAPNELMFQGACSRIEAKLPNSSIASNESVLIELSVLKNIAGVCQDSIELVIDPVDPKIGKISSGKFKTKVMLKDKLEFPTPFIPGTGTIKVTVEKKGFEEAIKHVEFAIADSIDKTWKQNFLCLSLIAGTNEITTLGCSDSVIALSKVASVGSLTKDLLLNKEIAFVLKSFTGKTLDITDRGNTILIEDTLLKVVTLPTNTKPPAISSIISIPKTKYITVDTAKFLDAIAKIDAAKNNAMSKSTLIDMDITLNAVKLKTLSNTDYEAFVDVDITSNLLPADVIKTAFNSSNMQTAISKLEGKTVKVLIADKKQFFCLEEGKKTYILVLSTPEST